VFGLAYLLAIQLMPRIRNWKDLTFYAPSERFALEHIVHLRELFTPTASFNSLPNVIVRKSAVTARSWLT
jgi:TnpA family transposase